MAKSESSRRGRKLRASKKQDEVQEEAAVEVKQPKEKKSRSSRKSTKSAKVEVAFMAEGDPPAADPSSGDAAPAQLDDAEKGIAAQNAEQKAIDNAVESGEFKSDFINVDDDDKKEIEEKAFKKTAVDARGKVHDFCDDCEEMANLMLRDALSNKGGRERTLKARMTLLTRLWQYRDTSDCEDDYNLEEWQLQMRSLATVQRKLRGLDGKIAALMMGGEMSSSDTDGEGEKQNMQNLKQARQNLRYSLGEGTVAG